MRIPSPRSWSDERYDYREVLISPALTREQSHVMLTEDAERGRWELARVTVYVGGWRRVRLRRRTMRIERATT